MRRSVLLALFALLPLIASAHQGDNWYFGYNCGVNFKTGVPVALTDGALDTREGCATISDTSGKLLFYTDGGKVFNNKHQVMPGGASLKGGSSSTQSSIIVPDPGNADRYYIIAADEFESNYQMGVTYSIVDMRNASGTGTVVQSNTPLQSYTAEKLTAVRHANGRDVWLIAHAIDTNLFYVWSITPSGISPTPQIFRSGPFLIYSDIGYMKANPQGTRLVVAGYTNNPAPYQLMSFDFDKSTGVISNYKQIATTKGVYGVEFSPSGRFLYASSIQSKQIIQYDLNQPQPFPFVIATVTSPNTVGALQMAPNGRIYVAVEFERTLSEISSPESPGLACGFKEGSVDLQGRQCGIGLPNFMPAIFGKDIAYSIVADTACVGLPTSMRFVPDTGISSALWNFGDPASGANNIGNGTRVKHTYTKAGTYTVTTTFVAQGFKKFDTMKVVVGSIPTVNAGFDVTICAGGSVKLQARGATTYRWSPGKYLDDSTKASPLVNVLTTTTFTVVGFNDLGCSNTDSVTVFVSNFKATLNGPRDICEGDSILLHATPGADLYRWKRSDGIDVVRKDSLLRDTPPQTVIYTVVISTPSCIDSANLTVNVHRKPKITVRPDTSLCSGSSVRLFASGGVSYRWTPAADLDDPTSPTPLARPTAPTRYHVTVTSDYGCTDTASVFVGIGSIAVSAKGDTTMCGGGRARLVASGADSYVWTDKTTGTTYTGDTVYVNPQVTTTYDVVGTSSTCTGQASVRVTINNNISITVSNDTTVCEGSEVTMWAQGALTYRWSPSTDLPNTTSATYVFRPTQTTRYYVHGESNGCSDDDSVLITVIPAQTLRCAISSVQNIPSGDVARLTVWRQSEANVVYPLTAHLRYRTGALYLTDVTDAIIQGRSVVGDSDDVELLITSGSDASILTKLTFNTFLFEQPTQQITLTFPAAMCGAMTCTPGSISTTNCANVLRVVKVGPTARIDIRVVPDPVTDVGVIEWSTSMLGDHVIQIVDATGAIHYSHVFTKDQASLVSGTIDVDATRIPNGYYIVRCISPTGTAVAPFVIAR